MDAKDIAIVGLAGAGLAIGIYCASEYKLADRARSLLG